MASVRGDLKHLGALSGDTGTQAPRARGRHLAGVRAPVDSAGAVPLDEAYEYCRQVTREIARTFYYGSLFLPPEKRRAAWALYAFCRTADDMADEPTLYPDPIGELTRWRAALLEAYAGRPVGPVMTAWADVLGRYDVPLQPALDLLDGVGMDVHGTTYATFEELRLYCYRVAGTVGLLMTPVLGYTQPRALEYAVDLGIAMQLTNILRDIGEDGANGRVYLPTEDLERFGYDRERLLSARVDDTFFDLVRFEIARAEEYYRRGQLGIPLLDSDSRLAIALSATLYRGILQRIRRNRYDVFTRRAHVPLQGKLVAIPATWLWVKRAGAGVAGA